MRLTDMREKESLAIPSRRFGSKTRLLRSEVLLRSEILRTQ